MAESYRSVTISFYGFGIRVESSDPETVEDIRRDFSFFVNDQTKPEITIRVFAERPDYSLLPQLRPSLRSPRNFCYRQNNILYVDYFGKGLSIIDLKKKEYRVCSPDRHFRHEIVFLTILSLAGEDLDKRHIHRVHSLGFEIYGKAVLVLLPQGGGKTTLALELLKHDGVRLISEDTPLIDSSGSILPFPIRIGIDAEGARKNEFPDKALRLIGRMEFGPKYLLDIAYFKDRITKDRLKAAFVFKGVRCLGSEARIAPASKAGMLGAFITNAVVGLGVYQGIEFLLENNPFELVKKSGTAVSRLKNSWRVVSKTGTYNFFTGFDIGKNCETLLNFVRDNKPQP